MKEKECTPVGRGDIRSLSEKEKRGEGVCCSPSRDHGVRDVR